MTELSRCFNPCSGCSVKLMKDSAECEHFIYELNPEVCKALSPMRFIMLMYRIYTVKLDHECHVNFESAKLHCDGYVELEIHTGPEFAAAFGKTLLRRFISQYNSSGRKNGFYFTSQEQRMFEDKHTGQTPHGFMKELRQYITHSLCVTDDVFDYELDKTRFVMR